MRTGWYNEHRLKQGVKKPYGNGSSTATARHALDFWKVACSVFDLQPATSLEFFLV
jgi:hypothetical protein